jgi:Tfp pilus assembly protein PilX
MKTRPDSLRRQRGATLVMAMIMVMLLSLLLVGAFNLSNTNLKTVGNMQWRDESVAAANQVLEQVVSSTFYNATTDQTFSVDIDKNGSTDYSVVVSPATCIRAVQTADESPSDVELGTSMSSGAFWNTYWDIKATVTDPTSGTSIVVREGVRVQMSATEKNTRCS